MSVVRPSFQFYPADWRNDSNLRRCSEAARGCWMDVLCVLHDSSEYGIVRWPLVDLSRSAGVPVKYLKELAEKGVLKGSDKGCDDFIYEPRHGGQTGKPVTLISSTNEPIWFCARFVRDEYVRQVRGKDTRFTSTKDTSEQQPKPSPKGGLGDRQGDGPSSSSSSSNNINPLTPSELSPPLEKPVIQDTKPPSGTRLPTDWVMPQEYFDFAIKELKNKSPPEILRIADGFRDYWIAQPGTKGRKTDWLATWRNWIRREAERYENVGKITANCTRKLTPVEQVELACRKRYGNEIFDDSLTVLASNG